ncbi:Uncharacterised protein [Serratia fonticola]|uniref:hypothetical protein n=1 Tax=Serratia fonticola TaxID=47917 RepID=UPI002183BCE6|nr:hypothetical protein [Serratia fonticola]CAI2041511.1 Uncharacterised protein [Serratia fonticola]
MANLKQYIANAFPDLGNTKKLSFSKQDGHTLYDRLSINDDLIYGYPESYLDILLWPGNAFVLMASLLDIRGDYRLLISGESVLWDDNNKDTVLDTGKSWRKFLCSSTKKDKVDISSVINAIQDVVNSKTIHKDVKILLEDKGFIKNIIILCLAADECMDRATYSAFKKSNEWLSSVYYNTIEYLRLVNSDLGFQLSFSSHNFGSVHYKNAVSQSGISLCSISHNLALIKAEVFLKHIERELGPEKNNIFNVLILPFPRIVYRDDFIPIENQTRLTMDEDFGFFTYKPQDEIVVDDVIEILKKSIRESDKIDVLVLPECSVSREKSKAISLSILSIFHDMPEKCPTLIMGVFDEGDQNRFGKNALVVYVPYQDKKNYLSFYELEQNKHHRWYLDRDQIFNYKLGSTLAPNKKWWEYTSVSDRSLISYHCRINNIQISPLICEDLARQDPVAPVVRSLGPNLIIALLLDGAQIKGRWPGRYASLLTEDPGSCVLTISPLGMTLRADGTGFPPSRNVAFWSDPTGFKELSLHEGFSGITLTLEKTIVNQWTADGRRKERVGFRYAGHICV